MKLNNYQNFLFISIFLFATSLFFIFPNVEAQNNEFLIEKLENALQNNPGNFKNLQDLASLYYESNMCNEAVSMFDRLLELKPGYPNAVISKANCLNNLGLPNEALSALDLIDQKHSDHSAVLIAIGNAHLNLGNFQEAEKNYLLVLQNDPENRSAINNMILTSKSLKDFKTSEKYLAKLVGNNPEPSELYTGSDKAFFVLVNDSEVYSVTLQAQIRNSSDQLIAIVESEKILYVPHPLIHNMIDDPSLLTETITNDLGTFEIRKITQKLNVPVQPHFLDRVLLYGNGYLVFFAYNLSVPFEDDDYLIAEWTIQKKIN